MRIERGADPGPFSTYPEYKPFLRPLFQCRCAHCLTPDDCNGGFDGMTIDHFRPQRNGLRLAWNNLYYACFPCNSKYKRDHPSEEDEKAGRRFVDVCSEDSDDHYNLAIDQANGDRCRLIALTDVARYSARILRLNERPDLRDFWRGLDKTERRDLERLREIDRLLAMLEELSVDLGEESEFEAIRVDYRAQREMCLQRLGKIRSRRPFPNG